MKHHALIGAISTLTAVYSVVCLAACAAQRSLMYPAPPRVEPAREGPLEWLRGRDEGGDTFALCAMPESDSAPVIVHFHGNGEQVAWHERTALAARAAGLGFCSVEYPGYGMLSHRSPSESALYAAADSVLAQLRARGVRRERVVLWGQSLGTGVASEMARRGHGSRLILLAPYTSMVDVVQRLVMVLPATLIVRDRYETARRAAAIDVPVLIVHGSQDELIPVEMGRGLARLFPRARLMEVAGRGHNDLLENERDGVWAAMVAFARGRGANP
jgi:pimeloyl-ACP methyl ester carboxylesterase